MAGIKRKSYNHDIASKFLSQEDYERNLVYCRQYDLFYIYREGWYEKLLPDVLNRHIYTFTRANFPDMQITANTIKDVAQQLKWMCYRVIEDVNHKHIAFNDTLYDLEDFKPVPFNREIYATHKLPFNYEDILTTSIDTFTNFLNTSLVIKDRFDKPDTDLIKLVQQMFGFFLIEDIRAGSAFFLIGDGANGKSVMAQVVQEMVGQEYCSAMSIQTLTTDKFAVQHLIGKKLNVSNEEESKYIRSDKFKALITGELVSAERKFGDSFEFIPRTKYLFATNQLPTFDGINYGIRRRIKIVPFHRIFKPEERDHNLLRKILKELPGIINWAIQGAKEIVDNNFSFSETKSSREAMQEFENEVSSSVRFVRENYEIDNNSYISNDDLYDAYKNWCEKVGKKPINLYSFHRDISNTIDGVKVVHQRDLVGTNKRGKNLKLIEEDEINADTIFTDVPQGISDGDDTREN
jgi:putative DNA primase/helicase